MSFIYALYDPREPERVRYVGHTIKPLEVRLAGHLSFGRYGTGNRHHLMWLRKLARENVKPQIKLLEDIPEEAWASKEQFWIEHCKIHGLTNSTAGGRGVLRPSEETRAKMRAAALRQGPAIRARLLAANLGKKASPEAIEKLRLSHIGLKYSEETKRKLSAMRRGRKMPPEFGAKISALMKGRVMKPEWIAKMVLAKRGSKWSEEQRACHSLRVKDWWRERKGTPQW